MDCNTDEDMPDVNASSLDLNTRDRPADAPSHLQTSSDASPSAMGFHTNPSNPTLSSQSALAYPAGYTTEGQSVAGPAPKGVTQISDEGQSRTSAERLKEKWLEHNSGIEEATSRLEADLRTSDADDEPSPQRLRIFDEASNHHKAWREVYHQRTENISEVERRLLEGILRDGRSTGSGNSGRRHAGSRSLTTCILHTKSGIPKSRSASGPERSAFSRNALAAISNGPEATMRRSSLDRPGASLSGVAMTDAQTTTLAQCAEDRATLSDYRTKIDETWDEFTETGFDIIQSSVDGLPFQLLKNGADALNQFRASRQRLNSGCQSLTFRAAAAAAASAPESSHAFSGTAGSGQQSAQQTEHAVWTDQMSNLCKDEAEKTKKLGNSIKAIERLSGLLHVCSGSVSKNHPYYVASSKYDEQLAQTERYMRDTKSEYKVIKVAQASGSKTGEKKEEPTDELDNLATLLGGLHTSGGPARPFGADEVKMESMDTD